MHLPSEQSSHSTSQFRTRNTQKSIVRLQFTPKSYLSTLLIHIEPVIALIGASGLLASSTLAGCIYHIRWHWTVHTPLCQRTGRPALSSFNKIPKWHGWGLLHAYRCRLRTSTHHTMSYQLHHFLFSLLRRRFLYWAISLVKVAFPHIFHEFSKSL